MTLPTQSQLAIERLGAPLYASPLRSHERFVDTTGPHMCLAGQRPRQSSLPGVPGGNR